MSYIGSSATPLPVNFSAVQSQSFNGTGSQTAFTISRSVPSAASLEVLVNNVQQSPYDGSYSVSGTTLTFSEAPSSGTNNVYVIYRDQALGSLVDQTAYRKSEADTLLAAKVNKAGDTMTGALALTTGSSVGAGTYALLKFGGDAAADDFHLVRETSGFNLYSGVSGAGTKRFGVDASGRVTMPNQPAFMAYNPEGQFVSGILAFNSTRVNVGSVYNSSNGRFTAPKAGMYLFSFDALCDNNGSVHGFIRINGTTYNGNEFYQDGITNSCVSKQIIWNMSAGDYADVSLDSPSRVHQRYGSFNGFLIG